MITNEEEEKKKKKRMFIIIGIAIAAAVILVIILILLLTFCRNTDIDGTVPTETVQASQETDSNTELDSSLSSDTAAQTIHETTVTTVEETTSSEESTTVTEDTVPEVENVAPTISLSIIKGPEYSPADGVCYYRVKATVTGVPAPEIIWSDDYSDSSFGENVTQINLHSAGETYVLTGTAENVAGTASKNITLTWGCNRPPEIQEITLMGNHYTSVEYEVSAAATDPDGDVLTYQWSVSGGSIYNTNINPMEWTTPSSPGNYNITLTVSDGKGGTDSMTAPVEVTSLNNKPVLGSIVIKDQKTNNIAPSIYAGFMYNISIEAYEPDGDPLSYNWTATGGTVSNSTSNPARWAAPPSQGYYTISVTVSDGRGGIAEQGLYVYVKTYVY